MILLTTAGSEALVWGAQMEVGNSATSLIVTGSSQTTRSSDAARINTLSPWFNPQEGTLLVDGYFQERSSNTWMAAFSNGNSLQDLIDVGTAYAGGVNRSRTRVLKANQTLAFRNGTDPLVGRYKIAVAYGKGVMVNSTNGKVLSAPLSDIPEVNTLGVGNIAGYNYSPGLIRSLRYFPQTMSESELGALTK